MVSTWKFLKSCHVVLNDIGHLLNEDGYYIVPGKRFRWLTCYKCFEKFESAEDLDIHKATHEEESEDEIVSDSDADIESESDVDEVEEEYAMSNKNLKPKTMRHSMRILDSESEVEDIQSQKTPIPVASKTVKVLQIIPKISDSPLTGSAESIQKTPVQSLPNPVVKKTSPNNKGKKIPAINNIHIKCINCDILFTNSMQLMEHKPEEQNQTCCFKCKVCSETYSTPENYMEHIMTHNSFTPKNYVVSKDVVSQVNDHPKKYRYICVLCNSRFEDCYQLRRHEINVHDKKEEQVYQSDKTKSKVVVLRDLYPGMDQLIAENIKHVNTNPTVRKRGRPPFYSSDASNAKRKKSTPKEIAKKTAQGKEKTKPSVKVSTPIEAESTKKVDATKTAETISYNVLRPSEPVTFSNSNKIATPPTKQSQEMPTSIKTDSLVCDICFDVFTDNNSFDEHMEFHNNLESTIVNTNTSSDNGNGDNETTDELEDDVTIVKDHSVPKIKVLVQPQGSKRVGGGYKRVNASKTIGDDENDDDSDVKSSNKASGASKTNKKFPTRCEDCKLTFKKHKTLRLHIAKKIHCQVCSFSSCKLPEARSHLLKQHNLHFCWRCKGTFEKAELLREHYKNDHTCNNCKRIITSKEGHICSSSN